MRGAKIRLQINATGENWQKPLSNKKSIFLKPSWLSLVKCEVQKLNWRLLFTSIGLKGHIYNNKKSCETQPGTGNWFKREIFAILSQGNTGNPRPYPQKIPSYKKVAERDTRQEGDLFFDSAKKGPFKTVSFRDSILLFPWIRFFRQNSFLKGLTFVVFPREEKFLPSNGSCFPKEKKVKPWNLFFSWKDWFTAIYDRRFP